MVKIKKPICVLINFELSDYYWLRIHWGFFLSETSRTRAAEISRSRAARSLGNFLTSRNFRELSG